MRKELLRGVQALLPPSCLRWGSYCQRAPDRIATSSTVPRVQRESVDKTAIFSTCSDHSRFEDREGRPVYLRFSPMTPRTAQEIGRESRGSVQEGRQWRRLSLESYGSGHRQEGCPNKSGGNRTNWVFPPEAFGCCRLLWQPRHFRPGQAIRDPRLLPQLSQRRGKHFDDAAIVLGSVCQDERNVRAVGTSG